MYRMYGIAQRAKDGGALMYRMYGQVIAPGITCTSTIRGGRMSQGAMDGGVTIPDDTY
jgi:hypothetical protein